jgi:VWFA-related protein
MKSHLSSLADCVRTLASLPAIAVILVSTWAVPAWAAIDVRVEARPASEPIEVYLTVTDVVTGDPVEALAAGDFTLRIDGVEVPLGSLTLPPAQDAAQRVSVVFAMDYSESVKQVALAAMQQSVIDFATAMSDGDQIAIIKFNDTHPDRASVVQPFTTIDHGVNNAAVEAAVLAAYDGDGTNILDALQLAVDQFVTPPAPLPAGPKAIILISDGGENESTVSESDVIAQANANGIPVFTIGVGDLDEPGRTELMSGLGIETGGQYYPTTNDQQVADAYAAISLLLSNEYLITIANGITDCAEHDLEVEVAGQAAPVTIAFTRRTCDTEPNPFSFTSLTGVRPNATATSNAATITGLEVPAHISVIQGRYSIGCNDTFVSDPGTISNGATVCVRHQSSNLPSTAQTTTLTIGGVAATFTTTTVAESGGGGGGGGGGAAGLFELLLGLCLLLFRRQRTA